MRRYLFTIALLLGSILHGWHPPVLAQPHARDGQLALVPQPKEVSGVNGVLPLTGMALTVSLPDSLHDRLPVLQEDAYKLLQQEVRAVPSDALITFSIDAGIGGDGYTLTIGDQIAIRGASGDALMHGWTSLLQLVRDGAGGRELPRCTIRDWPALDYRGVLLDVAREFQSVPSVEQVIDICRWYKIKYLQLHLNDDQLFVFPTTTFPDMPTPGKNYSLAEMKALVEYARVRGVVIVPEFDAPGHTGSLRRAYPELFGPEELRMLDVANPKALEACKVLIGEMMDVFYTSPYFHIGADEVFMGEFQKRATTHEAVKAHGFDEPHDLYLNYIVEMHEYVKSRGKKTIMWESFQGTGSTKVTIPNDILVYAWETMYQRPDDLIKHGYTILNASWKPIYITPRHRWTTEQIYGWNIWRWEHFLPNAPAWEPIQFGPEDQHKVVGVQLCAWEMTEEMNIPALLPRVAPLSEHGWDPHGARNYGAFSQRMAATDQKLRQLLFPAHIEANGLTDGKAHERFYNREHYFTDALTLTASSSLPGVAIRYTTDGTVPQLTDRPWDHPLRIDSTTTLRVALYRGDAMVGYRSVVFEKRPITVQFSGAHVDPESPIDWSADFKESLRVAVNPIRAVHAVKYTWNGETPTMASPDFGTEKTFNESGSLRIQCFDAAGNPDGSTYQYQLKKIN